MFLLFDVIQLHTKYELRESSCKRIAEDPFLPQIQNKTLNAAA